MLAIESTPVSTPAMRQYQDIKRKYPEAILFFRMGDFYEMFNEDAKIASKVLEITLTSRHKNKENPIPMCGIPYHAANSYVARLIKGGYKVAICEQVEDPNMAKGIVKREVIRVVTPGMILDSSLLDAKDNNYLVGIYPSEKGYGLSILDISTGEFKVTEFIGGDSFQELESEFNRVEPKEVLVPDGRKDDSLLGTLFHNSRYNITPYLDWVFGYDFAYQILIDQLKTISLDGFGCEGMPLAISSGGALIHYIKETQRSSLSHINRIIVYNVKDYMNLDSSTVKNMELVVRGIDGSRKGSLIELLDLTVTAMGGRRLKDWILKPLLDIERIKERHEAVEEFKINPLLRDELRGFFKGIYDIERITGRITLSAANARDLIALKRSINLLPKIEDLLIGISSGLIHQLLTGWDNLIEIGELIEKGIDDDPPLGLKDGGLIKGGFNGELDELRKISREGKEWITNLEDLERQRTGIGSLKVRYNKVYGYYIEVTKKNLPLVPEGYIRKQSLVNTERFISPELKEYESKILGAEERIIELEYEIFNKIREEIAGEGKRIQKVARIIAELDLLLSLAEVAHRYNYVRPVINEGDSIDIIEGRHPILEQVDRGERFIPNDTHIDCHENQILIITGPNMAGKSTYLRQVALIVLMAQIGGFVPAKETTIGIVDRIFTRVGAHDNLLRGQSTFMVEMNETANILNNATSRSLIILDEIGRGTSTFDGVSIAWSVVEYIHDSERVGARTLFATHYHELTELSMILKRVKNYNIAVREWNEEIIFLRKIVKGGADKSYGIQVARLAGLPAEVLKRAKEVMMNLEESELNEIGMPKLGYKKYSTKEMTPAQLSLFQAPQDILKERIREIDIDNITPMEALNKLHELKKMVGN
ncbi:MAG: DNA mismatch repair protein MutS [Nitrospinae bacterium]|nr:DNA mismatch repair protein MutS [Nitrospinota bacterium]